MLSKEYRLYKLLILFNFFFFFFLTAGAVDVIVVNGKIVTVDDRFSITQALAIKNQRVFATGSNADIRKLADANTKVIDVKGRTVIPGLIDNHAHWVRAAEHNELRLDGITSRKQAVKLLTDRIAASQPGEWVVVLGGWSEEQFLDDARGFALAELDQLAPNNPVVLQAVYRHSYLNSAALRAAKIDESTPNPPGGNIEKDANGRLTGVVRDAGGVAFVAAKVPLKDRDAWLDNTRRLVTYLNSLGITGWGDAGGRGMGAAHYEPYKQLAERGELNVRVFWTTIRQPATPEQADKVIAEIATFKPFQGNDYFENIGWGESVYNPVTTTLLRPETTTNPGSGPGRAVSRTSTHNSSAVGSHHWASRKARTSTGHSGLDHVAGASRLEMRQYLLHPVERRHHVHLHHGLDVLVGQL